MSKAKPEPAKKRANKGQPLLRVIQRHTAVPGRQLAIPLEFTSSNGFLQLAMEGPAGAEIDEATGTFFWTPDREDTGVNHFTITATSGGQSTVRAFDVEVDNNPPTITPIADQYLSVGQPLSLQVQAFDLDGDPLTFAFSDPAPPLTISQNGLISGTPTKPGTISVTVQVSDSHGETSEESFDVIVTNLPPEIGPISDKTISVGQLFSYQVQASDPEGQPVTYSLVSPAPPLSINSTGLISGTPAAPGSISVQVEVTDPHGASANESFDLIVENEAPTISSIPDQTISVGQSFSCQVQAYDPEGEPLAYRLVHPAPPLSINSNGLITGTPASPGSISVQIEVADPHGATADESFDLLVENQPPTISSIGDQMLPVGQLFSYQVQAHDPEGGQLAYQLATPAPPLAINASGLITGTPTSPGAISVNVRVTDPHGASSDESFDLIVENEPPTISSIPDQFISVGQLFSYQVQAHDPEGQGLAYRLVNPAPPLTINSSGLISGTPTSPGAISLTVEVTDPHGAAVDESFDVIVEAAP